MLKDKNQKITTVRFLITAIKTKTTYTFFFLYICQTTSFQTNSKIKLIIEKQPRNI